MQKIVQRPTAQRFILAVSLILTGLLLALWFPHPATSQPLDPCPSVFLNNGSCDDTSGTGICAAGTDSFDCSNPGGWTGQPGTASCPYALNGVCDEPHIGTGYCATGTDVADCKGLSDGFCQSANNGICDEPVIGGTGLCARGTDTADCFAAGCPTQNDGTCDEPGIGTGLCPAGTDAQDCSQRTSDTCLLANNGICNEPPNGSGCPRGTDTTDCSGLSVPGLDTCIGPDCCTYAYDGQCDEPGIGTGRCAAGTDQSDCRPPEPPKTGTVTPPPNMPADIIRDCQVFCAQGNFGPDHVRTCLRQCYDMWLSTLPPPGNRVP